MRAARIAQQTTSFLASAALLAFGLLSTPLAQSADQLTPPPPPPKMEKLEEGTEPGVTISKPTTERKITEKKVNGKVTEIKVKSGKSNYVLKPNDQPGSVQHGDALSNQVRGAQWQVGEFDLGQKKPSNKESKEDGPVPPAAASSASASSSDKK